MSKRDINILVVDDDEVDVESICRSFRRRRIANPIHFAVDGLDALELLRNESQENAISRPLIVLLDINMPRMNGLDFLREIRADNKLKDLVVFVLTTSADQTDIYSAYDLNVAGYIVKSDAGDCFIEAIELVEHYWRVVELSD